MAHILKAVLSLLFGWLGGVLQRRREDKATRAAGHVEGRAETHSEAYREEVGRIADAPPPAGAQDMNVRAEARRKRGLL